ncbi:MAG: hypothetical protein HY594_03025 [Candidatus Omnitrophica bacterium]|nr:hypothetical protein [Candidatus Omnitrophota bacterium]
MIDSRPPAFFYVNGNLGLYYENVLQFDSSTRRTISDTLEEQKQSRDHAFSA